MLAVSCVPFILGSRLKVQPLSEIFLLMAEENEQWENHVIALKASVQMLHKIFLFTFHGQSKSQGAQA